MRTLLRAPARVSDRRTLAQLTILPQWKSSISRVPYRGGRSRSSLSGLAVIEPNPTTPDLQRGFFIGGMSVVTKDGAVSLHDVPLELTRV